MLDWSWYAFFATIGWVLLTGYISFREGTFTKSGWRHVALPFIGHGGMWGDALLLPIVNAILIPLLHNMAAAIATAIAFALVVTIEAHIIWADGMKTCLVFPKENGVATGLGRMEWAGWLHVIYMMSELILLFLYILTAVPHSGILLISILLSLHLPLGVVQPGWYVTKKVKLADVAGATITIMLVWFVAWMKW